MSTNKPSTQQVEVQIMGQSYILACPDGGQAALMQAVERVDAAMCRIRDAGKVKARDRIAVLASLNLAFELVQMGVNGVSAVAPEAKVATPNTSTELQTQRWAALIDRLDQTLQNDGRLI
jgi:cell division protein ZapA